MTRNFNDLLTDLIDINTQELDDAGVLYEVLNGLSDDDRIWITTYKDGKRSTWPTMQLEAEHPSGVGSFRLQHPSERVLVDPRGFAILSHRLWTGDISLLQFERILAFSRMIDDGPLSVEAVEVILDLLVGSGSIADIALASGSGTGSSSIH